MLRQEGTQISRRRVWLDYSRDIAVYHTEQLLPGKYLSYAYQTSKYKKSRYIIVQTNVYLLVHLFGM